MWDHCTIKKRLLNNVECKSSLGTQKNKQKNVYSYNFQNNDDTILLKYTRYYIVIIMFWGIVHHIIL